ncbi:helix-turn-helix domain-containing protein [Chryseobacterium indoltheticum]|uniref:helix-turn-helix domain-containing protein n=1 Tax=Chryseobacterium indoltheticum TaxID=254 RepID=UPI003F493485
MDSELNLVKLADKLSLSTHQLSYIINNGFNENFFQFINKYKVEKAQELLTNQEYSHYTIIAIGYEAGFNSKTAFNTTFKKITSYTPTEYRKIRSNL